MAKKRPDWSYSGVPMPEEEINWNYLAGFVTASKIYGHAFKRMSESLAPPHGEFAIENLQDSFQAAREEVVYEYNAYKRIAERNDEEGSDGTED